MYKELLQFNNKQLKKIMGEGLNRHFIEVQKTYVKMLNIIKPLKNSTENHKEIRNDR